MFLPPLEASIYCLQHQQQKETLLQALQTHYEHGKVKLQSCTIIFEAGTTRITEHGLTKAQGHNVTVNQVCAYILQHYPSCNFLLA